ncbi:MAG TPA: acetate/propionate family kinase [Pyrinomonadaceae bacterium]|nr:acetate/propionate family kinase [Pyrinomonadaceae bacterium]
MDDYALVLNAGSSSLKFCVFRRPVAEKWLVEARGQIEGIGTSPRLFAKGADGKILAANDLSADVRDGHTAIDALASWLRSNYGRARVLGVGHRVVHGGTAYSQPTIVTPKVLEDLYELVPLAPLHQPHNLAAIQAVFEHLPHVPQVACFDTGFHMGRPHVAEIIPLPMSIRKTGLQRYGFHGLSYEYVTSTLAEIAPEIATKRTIIAHLGSGASLCAVDGGKSIDTSMSFTALDGLCMGTRPGTIDPGAVLYLFQTLGLTEKEVEDILYKQSGLLGISGISNDMRDLLCSRAPEARLAVDYFVYRAAREIGSLVAVLGGIDGFVFTAGIGENSPEVRRRICEACSWLGLELDLKANSTGEQRISTLRSKVSTWVVPTNEELMIARHTGSLLGLATPALTR